MDLNVIPVDLLKTKRVPDDYHFAKIAAIFKQGDPGNCSNYTLPGCPRGPIDVVQLLLLQPKRMDKLIIKELHMTANMIMQHTTPTNDVSK